jgi:hypothetical protein
MFIGCATARNVVRGPTVDDVFVRPEASALYRREHSPIVTVRFTSEVALETAPIANRVELGMTLDEVQEVMGDADMRCLEPVSAWGMCLRDRRASGALSRATVRVLLQKTDVVWLYTSEQTCRPSHTASEFGFSGGRLLWTTRLCGESAVVYDLRRLDGRISLQAFQAQQIPPAILGPSREDRDVRP